MPSLSPDPDPARCPLCGGPNACAMAPPRAGTQERSPCWCTRERFAPALLARVPQPARGRACICPDCARRARECP